MFQHTEDLFRLRRLFADLEAIGQTGGPGTAELENAPVLDGWRLGCFPVHRLCIAGFVSGGTAYVESVRASITEQVIAMDSAAGWARTSGRFYRLGRKSDGANGRPEASE